MRKICKNDEEIEAWLRGKFSGVVMIEKYVDVEDMNTPIKTKITNLEPEIISTMAPFLIEV